ncbi:hypothetical protein AAUPMB_21512, partial [Pasteurella multocida subsp. multocida str. Anand1_buffalo]
GAVLAKQPKKRWKVMYRIIEGIFFWEKGKHCKTAFQSELKENNIQQVLGKGD